MTVSKTTPNPEKSLQGINYELEAWDQAQAFSLARKDGIQLTETHFEVLLYLRHCYHKHGTIRHARSLTQALGVRYASNGGLRYLYQLFPAGPVSQGCKIAGLPIPNGAHDPSFGTVQ